MLRRYLLGELDESAEEQVEIRLLTDSEYVRQLDLTVDEIIDQFVMGTLTEAERVRVLDHFLKSDERQAKLRFALALKEHKSRRSASQKSQPQQKRFNPYLAVAASVLAILGIGFFAYRALRPEPDLNEGLVALQSAFREERPIDGRLSDFNHVPLPNQRGGSPRVDQRQRDLAAALLLKALNDSPTAATHQAAGKYYLMNHQFEQAKKELTAALELDPKNAKIHNDLGAVFLEEGRQQSSAADNSKQLELYGRSLEHIQKALELDNSLLEALFNRALVYQLMKPSEQAIQAWNAYLEKDSTSPWADEARRNINVIKQQLGVAKEKKDNLKNFLEAFQRTDDDAAREVLSVTYTSAGNEITNRLIDSYMGLEPFPEMLDPPRTLAALTYVAKLESDHAKDRYTSDLLTQYRATNPNTKSLLAQARQHMRTGYSSFEKSKFRTAIQEYTRAKTSYEQANDVVGKAFVEYRLAHCYVLLLDPERARLAYSQLLAFSEAKQYQWLAAQCLFGLAFASADSSEYSKALDYSSQALTRFEQAGDRNGTIKCLTQLADLNQAVNQIPTALGYLSRTRQAMEHVASQPMQTWTIFNQIGFSMTSLQLHTAALFYQKEALRIALDAGIPLIISRSYGYVGSAYAAMEMYAEAVTEATAALEMARNMTRSPEAIEYIAHASKQLGDIYREAGKCDLAIDFYDQSLHHYEQLKSDLYAYVAHKGKLHCFIQTSNGVAARAELRRVFELSESYRSKITVEAQRNSFFDAEQGVYDLAIGYQFGEREYVKALEYSEQSRARSLLDAVRRGNENRVKRKSDFGSLTVAEIQKRIPSNSQIVEYAVLDEKVLIWVVTSTDVRYADVPIPLSVLTEKINAFLDTINRPPAAERNKQNFSLELYELLIRPVKDYLDQSRVLIIVPDKLLNYLPFAALTSPANSRYLTEDYDLAVAPSGTLFANLSAMANQKNGIREERLLSVGDPRFDRSQFKALRDLPASVEEARTVAGLYVDPELFVREQAKESTITRELENADVAHLAMHFIVDEQSELLSGFPLTPEALERGGAARYNGFLQSQEIYGLNLRRMRLAILSACQTGIERQYRGEGAVGAARPFFVAGVPTVVASLWPVDSDASAKLMVNFHRHRRDPLPVIQALKKAQVEMIRGADERYRHPYYWAPFVAIGGLTNY